MIIPIINNRWVPGKSDYSNCTRCGLHRTRKRVALEYQEQHGPIKILMIGEAPGDLEDHTGYPFVGQAGKILRFMLKFAHYKFSFLLTNAIGCRPCDVVYLDDTQTELENLHPDDYEIINWNRNPTPAELKACKYHLDDQVVRYQPQGVIYLGKVATSYQLSLPSLTLLHPAYILRQEYKLLTVKKEARKIDKFIEKHFLND